MSRPTASDNAGNADPANSEYRAGRGVSRRAMLGLLGSGVVVGAGGATAAAAAVDHNDPRPAEASQLVPFHGVHQAGITTPAQDRLHFAAFDLTTSDRADLIALLKTWTAAAALMCTGRDVGSGAVDGPIELPPDDTGEALGLAAARLTVTVGFGTSLFRDAAGRDRFGTAARRPEQLADLPAFAGDALDPERSDGDLCVQACADDPQVAVHAIRNLARLARGKAAVRYSQLGFGRTSSTSVTQQTPRNLMGFKDGTNNLKSEDTDGMDENVWVQPQDGADWMTGGSFLVSRRIRMLIEPWDSTPLDEQQRVIGRTKGSGAPLGGTAEFDTVDLKASGPDGAPLVDPNAHVRLAHPTTNAGASLLRRGYSFVDGTDKLGRLDAGLFFLAYQRDPRNQFVAINRHLAGKGRDALNEYIQHVGSGLFACPPGVQPGQFWGQSLFD